MVIEEVSAIQENLEIERTCRESAEALASKVQSTLSYIRSELISSACSDSGVIKVKQEKNKVIK